MKAGLKIKREFRIKEKNLRSMIKKNRTLVDTQTELYYSDYAKQKPIKFGADSSRKAETLE